MPKYSVVLPSAQALREAFNYDPKTGALTRLVGTRRSHIGDVAGYLNNIGYRQVSFGGRIFSVHRLIWVMHYGSSPNGEVDHINGDRSDNRICNLRLATSSQNNQNRRLSSRNKTGIKGVFRVKWGKRKAWRVSLGHDYGEYYITHFECFGRAIKHAAEMRIKLHDQFARTA